MGKTELRSLSAAFLNVERSVRESKVIMRIQFPGKHSIVHLTEICGLRDIVVALRYQLSITKAQSCRRTVDKDVYERIRCIGRTVALV